MSKPRFGKAMVGALIQERVAYLIKEHRFDIGNGTAQLKPGNVDRAVAYGEMVALQMMAAEFGINRFPS